MSLAGGAAPPALRAAAKTDRGRPATAHGGPGPTPPGPDNHQPPGARARRGAARPGGTDGAEVRQKHGPSYGRGWGGAANEKKGRGRSPSQISLPLPGVPDFPLFRVVVGHIFHTCQLHVVHHFPNGRLNVAILAALVFRLKPRVHLHD